MQGVSLTYSGRMRENADQNNSENGRMVIGDRLHSTTEMLYEKNLTYSGTINNNRKVLFTEIKTVKE